MRKIINSYHTAVDMCKSNGDTLWLAGTLEGMVCANFLVAVGFFGFLYPASFLS
jgi:hypothetical protein